MSFAKIGYLFLRTLAKPLANSVKNYAKNHPAFHQKCTRFAQSLNRLEHRLRNAFVDQKYKEYIRPLSESKAIEVGANVIGEAVLFLAVSAVVLAETTRTSLSSRRKEAEQNRRLAQLEEDVRRLRDELTRPPAETKTETAVNAEGMM